jgi:hypothetical protein
MDESKEKNMSKETVDDQDNDGVKKRVPPHQIPVIFYQPGPGPGGRREHPAEQNDQE